MNPITPITPSFVGIAYPPSSQPRMLPTVLHKACKDRDPVSLKHLIASGTSVNEKDSVGMTPLMWAASMSFNEGIKILCRTPGVDLNIQDNDGRTALHHLPQAEKVGLCTLLGYGANPDIVNRNNCRGGEQVAEGVKIIAEHFRIKALSPHEKIVEFFKCLHSEKLISLRILLGRIDPNSETTQPPFPHMTLLDIAILHRKNNVVNLLIEMGASVTHVVPNSVWTPLHFAALLPVGGLEMARLLCEKGADPRTKDAYGKTPVDITRSPYTKRFLQDLAKQLDKQGVPFLNSVSRSSQTPKRDFSPAELTDLARDCFEGVPIAISQIYTIANLSAQFYLGTKVCSFLMHAVLNKNYDVVLHLLRAGANPNRPSYNSLPLLTAISLGDERIVHELVRAGAQLDRKYTDTRQGVQTPLHLAVRMNHPNIINFLLLTAGSVNDEGCHSALGALASTDQIRNAIRLTRAGRNVLANEHSRLLSQGKGVIEDHLDNGADINFRSGLSALHDAVIRKDVSSVRRLLEYGAIPNLVDGPGKKPLEYAQDHPEIMRMLMEAEAKMFSMVVTRAPSPILHPPSAPAPTPPAAPPPPAPPAPVAPTPAQPTNISFKDFAKIGERYLELMNQHCGEAHCHAWVENFIDHKGFCENVNSNPIWKDFIEAVSQETYRLSPGIEFDLSKYLWSFIFNFLGFGLQTNHQFFTWFNSDKSLGLKPLSQEVAEDIAPTALWLRMAEMRLFLKFPQKYENAFKRRSENSVVNCYVLTQDADRVVVYPLLVQTNSAGFVVCYSMDVEKKSLTHFTDSFVPRERLLELDDTRLVIDYEDALKIKPSSEAIVLWRQDMRNYFGNGKEKTSRVREEGSSSERVKRPRKPTAGSARETPVFTFNDLFPDQSRPNAKRGALGALQAPPSKRTQKGYRDLELDNHWTPANYETEEIVPTRKRGRPRKQKEGPLPILPTLSRIEEPEINEELTPENFMSVICAQSLRSMRKTVGREAEKRAALAQAIVPLAFPVQQVLAQKGAEQPPFIWIRWLKPYQIQALSRILSGRQLGLSELLCLDMGLGKTMTFTHFLIQNILEGDSPGIQILAAPASLVYQHEKDIPEHLIEASIVAWQLSGRTATPEVYGAYFEEFFNDQTDERWTAFLRIYPYFAHAIEQAGAWYSYFTSESHEHQPKIIELVRKHLSEIEEFLNNTPGLRDTFDSRLSVLAREFGYTLGMTNDHLIDQLARPMEGDADFHKLCTFAGRLLDLHPGRVPLPNVLPDFPDASLKRLRDLGYTAGRQKRVVFTEVDKAVAGSQPHKVLIVTLNALFKDLNLKLPTATVSPSLLMNQPIRSLVVDEASLVHTAESKTTQRLLRAIEMLKVRNDPTGKNNLLLVTGTPLENHFLELWTLLMLAMGMELFPISTYNELNVLFMEVKKRLLSIKLNELSEMDEDTWHLVLRSFVHFVKLRTIVSNVVCRKKKTDADVKEQWHGRIPERRDFVINYELPAALVQKMNTIMFGIKQSFFSSIRQSSNLLIHTSLEGTTLKDQKKEGYPFLNPLRNKLNHSPEEREAFLHSSMYVQAVITSKYFEETIRNKEKFVIVCDTIAQAKLFKKALKWILLKDHPEFKVYEYNGSKNAQERTEELDKFKKRKDGKLSACTLMIKSGGYGVNIPMATTLFTLPTPWNPGQEEQAVDRTIRVNSLGVRKIIFIKFTTSQNDENGAIISEHPLIVQRIKRNWESFFWGEAASTLKLLENWMDVIRSETLLDCLHLKRDVKEAYNENAYIQQALERMRSQISEEYLANLLNRAGAVKTTAVTSLRMDNPLRPVGFGNSNNNCWCNAMLQLVLAVPSLKAAYEDFAAHYTTQANESGLIAEQGHRNALQHALTAYFDGVATETAVDGTVSQNVRLALSHFFRENLRAPSGSQEDATEALALILGGVQAERHSLFTPVTFSYEGVRDGEPISSRQEQLVSTIILEVQGKDGMSFNQIFGEYFDSTVSGVREQKQFTKAPEEFLVTVQRFRNYGMFTLKWNGELEIPLRLTLPSGAVEGESEPLEYELDSFIVHNGLSPNSGHYITVKKENGGWWMCDDQTVTPLLEEEVRTLFANKDASGRTSYLHHYRRVS